MKKNQLKHGTVELIMNRFCVCIGQDGGTPYRKSDCGYLNVCRAARIAPECSECAAR